MPKGTSRRATVTKTSGSRASVVNYGQTARRKKGKRKTAKTATPTGNYARMRRSSSSSRTSR